MFNAKTFWAARPQSIPHIEWLTHPANDQAMPFWVQELIRLIGKLANPETYFKQKWLIPKLGKSIRQIKEMISRLKKIGLISVRRVFRRNRMKLTAPTIAPKTAPVHEEKKNKDTKDMYPEWIREKWQRITGGKIPIGKWWRENRDLFVGF